MPPSSRWTVSLLACTAMLAFAGNSLLCRLALRGGSIDAASFTTLRLLSGAVVLALIVRLRSGDGVAPTLLAARSTLHPKGGAFPSRSWLPSGPERLGAALRRNFSKSGDWPSALALFVYAAGFSWAYLQLTTATGALLLFGAVQVTMIGFGLWRGERLQALQWAGLLAACVGLVEMLLPGLSAPPLGASLLMLSAGVAWGAYSLRGRGRGDPTATTAGNFWRASLLAVALSLASRDSLQMQHSGALYALASGALASGLGYSIWYTALRGLSPSTAASIQLTVPALAALGAVLFLGESVTLRLFLTSLVILGGVALVIVGKARAAKP